MQIIARLAIIFSDAVAMHRVILGLIKAIAMADGKMDSAESALLNNAIKAFRTISKLKYYECILENIDISNGNVFTSNLDNKKFYKKAINVISSYAHWLEPEQIIAIYDATIFGKADKGAILTKLGVQVSHSKKSYYYSELTKEVIYNEICFFTKELDDIYIINFFKK